MLSVTTENEFGSISPEQLKAVELFLPAKLPDDYRNFLIKSNGGVPVNFVSSTGGSGETSISYFYGIHSGPTWASFSYYFKNSKSYCSEGQVPIASDDGGNFFILSLTKNRGCISFCDHETNEISKVAESFTEFATSLRPGA